MSSQQQKIEAAALVVKTGLDFVEEVELEEVIAWWTHDAFLLGPDGDTAPDVFVRGVIRGWAGFAEALIENLEGAPAGQLSQKQADLLGALRVIVDFAKTLAQSAGATPPTQPH